MNNKFCSKFRPGKRQNCKSSPLITCWVSSINPDVDAFYQDMRMEHIFYEVAADDWATGTTELTICESDILRVQKLKDKYQV